MSEALVEAVRGLQSTSATRETKNRGGGREMGGERDFGRRKIKGHDEEVGTTKMRQEMSCQTCTHLLLEDPDL